MKRFSLLFVLGCMFMNVSIATEYIYSDTVKVVPEKIELSDETFQNNIYSYFNSDNILKYSDQYHNFKPVIDANISASQIDPFRFKVTILLTNNKRDWYIPRFEERTVYSEKKIYMISESNEFLGVFPKWWSSKKREPNSPIIYISRPEHIGLFAKFKKGDKYKLEYIVQIPELKENQMIFDLFYQDYKMPYEEIFNKYSKSHNSTLPNLTTKSNIIKVKCAAIDSDIENGFNCTFGE